MLITALDGALVLVGQTWRWRTGETDPRLRPLRLRDVAPSFRIAQGDVEIPHDWQSVRYWRDRGVDPDARARIRTLLANRAMGMVFAEDTAAALDDHRVERQGYRVPVAEWDEMLSDIIGVQWDAADEAAILARARELSSGADR